MKLCFYRKNFFYFIFLFVFSCQTLSLKQKRLIEGSQGKKYELITPNIVGVYKDGNLIKKGRVQTGCPKNICNQDTIKNLSSAKIESFLKQKQGEWTEYIYKDGTQFLKRKGLYRENKREGIWEEYAQKKTENGKWKNVLLKNLNYKNDKRNGPWKQFREDGQVLKTGTYRNGLKENKEYKYSTENKKIELKIYKNGKLNGEYWRKDSKTEQYLSKGFYKDDLKDSNWIDYYKDGRIKKKRIYREGKLNGSEKNYYPSGKLQSEGENSNDHKIDRWKFYYPNGVKNTEGDYKYNPSKKKSLKVEIWKEYYSNGQLFAKGPRKHTRTGKWIFYFPNQQKAAQGEMTNEFNMSEGSIYDKKGLLVGKGKLQFSIFRISPSGDSLKMKYRAGVPFTYYKKGKKYLEVQSNDIAIEYDKEGKKVASGPILPGSTKKNGCWNFPNGKKVYYINNKIKKGKIAKLQNCG